MSWIDVNDGLPDINKEVLVWSTDVGRELAKRDF